MMLERNVTEMPTENWLLALTNYSANINELPAHVFLLGF